MTATSTLLYVVNRFFELAVSWRYDFPSPEVVGKPMAVRIFHLRNVWICFDMACTRRSNMMIHEAWSHFQGIWYALEIWISEDDWLCKDLEHDVWEINDLQTFTFLQNDGVILPHVPFIQIPWRSTRRSRHFRLHRLRQATAGSFQWPNLAVAASHPTAGQDQQCLSVWTWIKLNRKLQSPTLYNVFCA